MWLVLLAQVCCLSWNTMLMVIANLCQLVMMPSSIVLSFLSMLLLHRSTQRMYLHFSIVWNPGIYPKVTKCSCSTSLGIQMLKLMYCYGKLCVSSQGDEEQWRMVILCHLCCFFQTSLTPCYDSFCYWVGEGKIKNPSFFFFFLLFSKFSIFSELRNTVTISVSCIHTVVLFDIPDTRNILFKKWNKTMGITPLSPYFLLPNQRKVLEKHEHYV